MIRVEWVDLLTVPYLENGDDPSIGLDCWGQACEVARRAGLSFPVVGSRPSSEAALHECAFERVPRADRAGDVLAADPHALGFVSHVSSVVDAERGLALSTSPRAGAFCWPIRRVGIGLGVWRLK